MTDEEDECDLDVRGPARDCGSSVESGAMTGPATMSEYGGYE
jgi:hypothetical protein